MTAEAHDPNRTTSHGLDRHEDHVIVPMRRKIAYGLGTTGDALVWDIFEQWGLIYFNAVMKMNAIHVGWAISLPRIWDAISDPLMGQISDNFRSRWGRRRPFILIGGPLFCLMFIFLWTMPEGLSSANKFAYLLVANFVLYTFWTVANVPYLALGAELSIDYDERTRVVAVRTFIATAMGLLTIPFFQLANTEGLFASPRQGFIILSTIIACVCSVGYICAVLGTREEAGIQAQPKMSVVSAYREAFKNVPFLLYLGAMAIFITGGFITLPFANYLNIYYVHEGDMADASRVATGCLAVRTGCMFIGVFLVSKLGTRIGKRTGMILTLWMLTIAPLCSWFLFTPESRWLQLVFHAIHNLVFPGIFIFPGAMAADIADADEIRTGRRREGIFLGVYGLIMKIGTTSAIVATGYCLSWASFDENIAVQSPETIFKLRLMMAAIPVVVAVLCTPLLLLYPLSEKRVREMRAILEARREQQRSA